MNTSNNDNKDGDDAFLCVEYDWDGETYEALGNGLAGSALHPVRNPRFWSFRTQPLEICGADSVRISLKGKPTLGTNLGSRILAVRTGCNGVTANLTCLDRGTCWVLLFTNLLGVTVNFKCSVITITTMYCDLY